MGTDHGNASGGNPAREGETAGEVPRGVRTETVLPTILSPREELLQLPEGRRALIVNEIVAAGKKLARQRANAKSAWVAEARKGFVPSEREACAVCGRYKALAQAHHVFPLGEQFDARVSEPIHDHVWLCPTHHAGVHFIINAFTGCREPYCHDMSPEENAACDRIVALFQHYRVRARAAA